MLKDLNEITVFVRVAQHLSFSKAAQSLEMPVSTVSRKVSDLEKRLKMTLIQRTTRRLQLTPAGETYYQQCYGLLEAFEEAEALVTDAHKAPEGPLRVTIPVGMASGGFAHFLSRFLTRYPEIRLDLVVTNQYVDIIAENIDVAIRAGHLGDSTLIAKRLGSSQPALVASPSFLKKHGAPKKLQDLKNYDCLLYRSKTDHDIWEFTKDKVRQRVKVSGRVKASDMTALQELALRGHGIALLPEMYSVNELKKNLFIQVLPEWKSPLSPVHAVYPKRKFLPLRLATFLSDLEAFDCPDWVK